VHLDIKLARQTMPTIAIVSQKGGSGKTTLAINLAVAATNDDKLTCIIDTDPQATAAAWSDWRGDYQPEVITTPPARLARTLQTCAKADVEVIVIDTPPHADAAAREAVKAADIVLVPTRPRPFDLHALEATAELIAYARKLAFVVLNGVPAEATRVIAEASEYIQSLGLKVCPLHFGERAAFHHSSAAGEVASVLDPAGKAAAETEALWQWLSSGISPTQT
jgi:chromosome partitioning protein